MAHISNLDLNPSHFVKNRSAVFRIPFLTWGACRRFEIHKQSWPLQFVLQTDTFWNCSATELQPFMRNGFWDLKSSLIYQLHHHNHHHCCYIIYLYKIIIIIIIVYSSLVLYYFTYVYIIYHIAIYSISLNILIHVCTKIIDSW